MNEWMNDKNSFLYKNISLSLFLHEKSEIGRKRERETETEMKDSNTGRLLYWPFF